MRFFFAGADSQLPLLRAEGVRNILVPYPAFVKTPKLLDKVEGLNVFLDSGAWSVASGVCPPIDINVYAGFVQQRRAHFGPVASLDVIGDAVKSEANHIALQKHGVFDALPCWHVGEPLDLATRYAATSEYVAIGGLAARKSGNVPGYIAHVWPAVKARKVHMFGVSTAVSLAMYRPESADSTVWMSGAKFGEVLTLIQWPKMTRVVVTKRIGHFTSNRAAACSAEFQRFGTSWRELAASAEARVRHNIRVLFEFERRLSLLGVATTAPSNLGDVQ